MTFAFPNINGASVIFWEWDKQFHLTLYSACDYSSMLWLKFIYVSNRGP